MERVLNKAGWIMAAIVSLTVLAALAGLVSAGPLDPPGAPGSTMKTLQEVEPRTPISSLPYTISSGGSYYLTGNLTGSSGSQGITISASDVTLDFNGFALIGPGGSGTEEGVSVGGGARNVTVQHGTIRNWGGDGMHVGGFGSLQNYAVRRMTVDHNGFNGYWGIDAATGFILIEESVISDNGTASFSYTGGVHMFEQSTIRNSKIDENYNRGILGSFTTVIDNNVVTLRSGSTGIETALGGRVENNDVTVFGLNTGTVGISAGTNTVVVKNSVGGAATNYSIGSATAGPIESTTPLTNPWANISK